MKLSPKLTTVTGFSKFVALAMFVALPFIGFYFGVQYKKSDSIPKVAETVTNTDFGQLATISKIKTALELYRSANKKYPVSLNNLVPDYLAVTPDEKVFEYIKVNDAKYIVKVINQSGVATEITNE